MSKIEEIVEDGRDCNGNVRDRSGSVEWTMDITVSLKVLRPRICLVERDVITRSIAGDA